ncbi:MAG TPA: NAD-dependent epimerase/dehydratase family protein, partial [Anaerolineales bacterium]|nr:NAD-dependent epimerase/dehydratase family protein [Anaerolineales bacterium]
MTIVLITGGTGFTGLHLAERLLRAGYAVRLGGRDFSQAGHVLALGAQARSLELSDSRSVLQTCDGVQVVCHVGALSSAWGKFEDFWQSNVVGTQNVVQACRACGVGRLVHISSPSAWFDGTPHKLARESDLTPPRRWLSHYSQTKFLSEQAVLRATDVNAIILRPKAIFGEGDRALLPRLITAARHARLRIFGTGDNQVDLTYVGNVVQAIQLAIEKPQVQGAFLLTNGEHPALWQVIFRVLDALGIAKPTRRVPFALALGLARAMEMFGAWRGREPLLTEYSLRLLCTQQTYDISAVQHALGYQPETSLDTAIARTIAALGVRFSFSENEKVEIELSH